MKKFILIGLLNFLPNAFAQGVSCNGLEGDSNTRFVNSSKIEITTEFNIGQLTKIMAEDEELKPDELTFGFTKSHYNPNFTYEIKAFRNNNGIYCAVPNVDMEINLDEMIIFISTEAAQNKCTYDATLEHEKHHVALYEKMGPIIANNANKKLKEKLKNKYFFAKEGNTDSLFFQIDNFIKTEMIKIMNDELQQAANEHSKQVDTPEEINKQSNMCNGLAQKMLSKY